MTIVETVVKACPKDKPNFNKKHNRLEGWRKDIESSRKEITFSPEFLILSTPNEDFEKQKFMLFRGGNVEFWNDIFIPRKGFEPTLCLVEELILTKFKK